MNSNTLYLFIFLLLTAIHGICQQTIDTIHIFDNKPIALRESLDIVKMPDSIQSSVLGFLNSIEGGQVQNITPGGISSFLYRGFGNRHLPILWNGVNIQSITNGSFDISLIPSQLFDGTSFYTFGSPSLLGNNAMAGALNLDKRNNNQMLSASLNYSSLQNFGTSVNINVLKKKWSHKMGFEYRKDKNIFSYNFNNKNIYRTSTEFENNNVYYNSQYYISNNKMLSFDVWGQYSDRIIPVSITSTDILQTQEDKNLRANLKYQQIYKSHSLISSLTILNEKLDFRTTGVDSKSNVTSYIASAEYFKTQSKDYYFMLKWRKDIATPNFYVQTQDRQSINFAFSKIINLTSLIKAETSVRQDLVNQKLMPLSLALKLDYKNIHLNLARNYNLPGFNDLYWPQGGNKNLKTEIAYQADIHFKKQVLKTNLDVHIYANLIDNWIQWLPLNSGIWQASNQKQVLSKGLDIKLEKQLNFKSHSFQFKTGYGLNFTTATKHYFQSELIGKQLIYIPQNKLNFQCLVSKNRHRLFVEALYTGERSDSPDNVFKLDPYSIVNLGFGYKTNHWNWTLKLNNLTNEKYAQVRFFPMPGFHTSINCTISL